MDELTCARHVDQDAPHRAGLAALCVQHMCQVAASHEAKMGSEKNSGQEQLAANVRRWRQDASISQEALADSAGLSRATVAAIELGRYDSTELSTIEALAQALSATPAELLGRPTGLRPNRLRNNLRKVRCDRGLTLEEVAARLGAAYNTIARYEKGERGLSLEWTLKIARAIGCHPVEILPDEFREGLFDSRPVPGWDVKHQKQVRKTIEKLAAQIVAAVQE